MSKGWAEKNRSQNIQDYAKKEETFASRNTNGTGPYVLKTWEPDKRIVFEQFKGWWGKLEGNVTDQDFSPEELTEAGAVAVFESLDELLERIDESPLAS